ADTALDKPPVYTGVLDARHTLLVKPCSIAMNAAMCKQPQSQLSAFPDTGYFVIRKEQTALLYDVGLVCPDDLPAHAHADIFTYELSIEGRRWIVDSGVREYQAGAWRDYARSTRAHNTVVVNGQNQVDVWSSFRVGRRVRPRQVSYSQV